MVRQPWKIVWRFFQKSVIELPYDLAVLLLGLYPEELETGTQTTYASYASVFTAAYLQYANDGNNQNVHLTD